MFSFTFSCFKITNIILFCRALLCSVMSYCFYTMNIKSKTSQCNLHLILLFFNFLDTPRWAKEKEQKRISLWVSAFFILLYLHSLIFSNLHYLFKAPRQTNILFGGSIRDMFWNMITQNTCRQQYRLPIILYDFFVFFRWNGKIF